MNELTVQNGDGRRMTSIEVAELTGKRHDHVMRDVKVLIEQGAIGLPNFGESVFTNSQNKEFPMYSLDFKASMVLVTGYDAVKRAAVIDRWVALETGEAKPKALPRKQSSTLPQVEREFRSALKLAKMFGLHGNSAVFSANAAAQKLTGINCQELLGIEGIAKKPEERLYTPTELGSTWSGISAKAMNTELTKYGMQIPIHGTPAKGKDIGPVTGYRQTMYGANHSQLIDTGKRNSNGAMVQQLKWKWSVISAMGQIAANGSSN